MTSKSYSSLCFDQLPVELIEKILHYLDFWEILHSFGNINRRLNEILLKKTRYEVNFKSISLSNFCRSLNLIEPAKVVNLCLSNDEETPGAIETFLSNHSLNRFENLEELYLIQPEDPMVLNRILVEISFLNNLKQLSIVHCQPASVNSETIRLLSEYLDRSKSIIRLNLSGAWNSLFETNFHSTIEEFYLNDNVFNTISLITIISRMKHLKSLETSVTINLDWKNMETLTNLTRLNLTFFISMSNDDLGHFFARFPSLVDLKLVANGANYFDGNLWEKVLPKHLKKFQFNFSARSNELSKQFTFETFQSEFWLNVKRWHVIFDYQMNPTMVHIYSLPYCDKQFYYRPSIDLDRHFRCSAPTSRFYMKNVTKLTLDLSALVTEVNQNYLSSLNPSLSSNHYFPNVRTLILSDNSYFVSVQPLIDCLKSIVDLEKISELKLGHFHYPDLIRLIHSSMPRLQTLWISEKMFAKLETIDFRHIRTLHICDCLTNVDRLCLMFPELRKISLRLTHFERMRRLLELLDKTIRNVTFKHVTPSLETQLVQWLTETYKTRRQVLYQIDAHMSFHIWFSDVDF